MSTIFPYIAKWEMKYDENPVGALQELTNIRRWTTSYTPVQEIGPSHSRLFATAVVVNSWKFREIKDRLKKNAKKHAAHLALRVIYLRTKCVMEDKIPEQELELQRTLNLCVEDLKIAPNFVAASNAGEDGDGDQEMESVHEIMARGIRSSYVEVTPSGDEPKSAKKRKYDVASTADKNAVNILLEFCKSKELEVNFEFAPASGPVHLQIQCVTITVGDTVYPPVMAHSKKACRHNACVKAIQALIEQGHTIVSDPENLVLHEPPAPQQLKRKTPVDKSETNEANVSKPAFSSSFDRNPIILLTEYSQTKALPLHFEMVSETGKTHNMIFSMVAVVGERKFPQVESTRKQIAKMMAAEAALKMLMTEGWTPPRANSGFQEMEICDAMTDDDKFAALSHRKANQLITQTTSLSLTLGRKIISTIIMRSAEHKLGKVVAFGMGNKVIPGDQLSMKGDVLNDSHAEVIARRAFIRFLYDELIKFKKESDSMLYQFSKSGKLCVKKDVTFHMYISTAPCGDGAIFSPKTATAEEFYAQTKPEPIYMNPNQGLLRTKIEGGEGTVPTDLYAAVQTWDGLMRGERLRTMSCSDKMCKWNVIGLQGALLSHYLDPVYLTSVTLGGLYHAGHLSRAISLRLSQAHNIPLAQNLPAEFKHNVPTIGRATACRPGRAFRKSQSVSINWMLTDELPEVTNAATGYIFVESEMENLPTSRLSKANLFELFKLANKNFRRADLKSFESYHSAKVAAKDYQAAKLLIYKRFLDNRLGKWLSKPMEEDMFA